MHQLMAIGFTAADLTALLIFFVCWFLYHVFVEVTGARTGSLNSVMDEWRVAWLQNMATRDNRMLDAITSQALLNGTAFFASTSVLGVGGALALLGSSDQAISVFNDLPFGITTSRQVYECKVMGLVVLQIYAFFKFAWAYRLFSYCAILIGAVPQAGSGIDPTPAVERASQMNIAAAMHFNRGLRTFFFSLAYLGWFISPTVLVVASVCVVLVLIHRQFASRSLQAAVHKRTPQN
jgi:uncharacterized membrane protein